MQQRMGDPSCGYPLAPPAIRHRTARVEDPRSCVPRRTGGEPTRLQRFPQFAPRGPPSQGRLPRATSTGWRDCSRSRDRVLLAGMIAACFMVFRAFRALAQYPWELCRGDIVRNLLDLASGPDPGEECASKIRLLLLAFHIFVDSMPQGVPWSLGATEGGA